MTRTQFVIAVFGLYFVTALSLAVLIAGFLALVLP